MIEIRITDVSKEDPEHLDKLADFLKNVANTKSIEIYEMGENGEAIAKKIKDENLGSTLASTKSFEQTFNEVNEFIDSENPVPIALFKDKNSKSPIAPTKSFEQFANEVKEFITWAGESATFTGVAFTNSASTDDSEPEENSEVKEWKNEVSVGRGDRSNYGIRSETLEDLELDKKTLDVNGIPWDSRIHSRTRATNADGTWRQKRGVDLNLVKQVESKLKNDKKETTISPQLKEVSVIPIPVEESITYGKLLTLITHMTSTNKISHKEVVELLNKHGVENIPMLGVCLDKVPAVYKELKERGE